MWPFFPIKNRFSQLIYRENQINVNEEKFQRIGGIEKIIELQTEVCENINLN